MPNSITNKVKKFKNFKLRLVIIGTFFLFLGCFWIGHTEAQVDVQQAGQKTVTGKVTDITGVPLPGVSVRVKGESTGSVTNGSGVYSIKVGGSATVLVYSLVGYITQEKKVGDKTTMDISLAEEVKTLDDVVIIGYGEVQRKDLTGSVTSIQSDELMKGKPLSFQEALQGKLAGVQVSSSSGEPGAAVAISIRGANTIYGGSSPLFVIDGIPYDLNSKEIATSQIDDESYGMSNPLATLNPQDIESIDILKDASATAIYGSKGANGVIIITTKAGKAGQMRVEYNGSTTLSDAVKKLKVLDASDYIEFRRLVSPNSSLFYYDSNKDGLFNELDDPKDPYALPFHNWQNEILRQGVSNDQSITLSGGRDGTRYSGSAGYVNEKTILIANNFDRYNFRLRVDHSKNKFDMGLGAVTGYTETKGPSNLGVIQSLSFARPIEYFNEAVDLVDRYISPIAMITKSYRNRILLRTNMTGYIGYKFNNSLSFRNTFGAVLTSSKGKEFYNSETAWGREYKGIGILQDIKSNSIRNTSQLNYTKRVKRNHLFRGMVGFEVSRYNYENFSLQNSYFLDESTGVDDIGKGSKLNNLGSSRDISTQVSYFGRFNYSFRNLHLVTATFRADGSDKFGPDNRFAYFPSFAYAWNISNEKFLKDSRKISDLKLRLTYGKTGNDRIPSFRYLAVLENAYYSGQLGLAPASMANPDLKWETTDQFNMGLDIGLMDNRVLINLDLYNKRTRDMLLPAYVPTRTGYIQQWQNLGLITNKGIELAINTINIRNKDFSWTTGFNISSNRNIVNNIGNVGFINASMPHTIKDQGRIMVGGSIGDFYGYVFDGIYQIDDFTWQNNSDPSIPHQDRVYVLKDGIVSQTGIRAAPGFFKYKDLNGDGFIDLDNDRKIIGRSFPKHFGGITNTITYKNFDLNIFLDWSYGNQLFNLYRFQFEGGLYGSWQNLLQDFWDNRWTPENPTNKYGDIATYNLASQYSSTYYIEDASWLRLKDVTIGYQFSGEKIKKLGLGISNVRVFVSGTYLVTWTKYSGFYPEVSSNNPLLPGVDRISFPRSRNFSFGLNVKF
ncbi:MAG: TonB-dependent receptor [Chitinophagaceae bacterium]|nr:TonB-dependent receptor [Chitinophagaceae bacterium]